MNLENIYKNSKPEIVKVALIGESPPIKEGNLFYFAPDSDLFNFTKEAFDNVYGKKIKEVKSFLSFFKSKGFYLDDLCHKPINDIKDEYKREGERRNSIDCLASRLAEYNPIVIIGIMKKIKDHITEAISLSKIEPLYIFYLGYPTHSKRNILNYINGLESIIRKLVQEGILDN